MNAGKARGGTGRRAALTQAQALGGRASSCFTLRSSGVSAPAEGVHFYDRECDAPILSHFCIPLIFSLIGRSFSQAKLKKGVLPKEKSGANAEEI